MELSVAILKKSPPYQSDWHVYSSPAWLAIIKKHFNLQPYYLECRIPSRVLAYFVVFEQLQYGHPRLVCPPLQFYQAINYSYTPRDCHNKNQELNYHIDKAIAEFIKQKWGEISIQLTPKHLDVRAYLQAGFHARPLYTYLLNKNTHSFHNYYKKTKASIRKANELGYRFDTDICPSALIDLNKETFKRQSKDFPLTYPDYQKLIEDIVKNDLLVQCNARINGQIVSALAFIKNGDSLIAYSFGTHHDWLKKGAAGWLFHEAFEYLFASGTQEIDITGANIESIAKFKASFGSQLSLFFRINYQKAGLIKGLKNIINKQ